jgi:hypothetical protein
MARLPTIRRIRREDFDKKYYDLLDGLLYAINTFFESVVAALNRGLTFRENMQAQVQDLTVTAPVTDASFKRELALPCTGIMVVAVTNINNPGELLSTSPFAQFVNTDGGIRITNITGLTAGQKYRVRLICLNE